MVFGTSGALDNRWVPRSCRTVVGQTGYNSLVAVDPSSADLSWAWEKWRRAYEHVVDLHQQVMWWNAHMEPLVEGRIAEDRLSWESTLTIGNWPPPTDHWALTFGDAVHNLRSALDVLVWTLSDKDGLSERDLKNLQFPMVDDEAKWEADGMRRLRGLPDEVVERIRMCQPFNWTKADQSVEPSTLLHALDIEDKHRQALVARPYMAEAELQHAAEFATEAGAARNVPPDVHVDDSRIDEGVIRYYGSAKDPISKINGTANGQLNVLVDIPGDRKAFVFSTLETLTHHVAMVLCEVSGQAPPAEPLTDTVIADRWPHRAVAVEE